MIPARFAPLLAGLLLSGQMSLVVSAVATLRTVGPDGDFLWHWMGAWWPAWAVAFPVVLVVAPLTRRLVARWVHAGDRSPRA